MFIVQCSIWVHTVILMFMCAFRHVLMYTHTRFSLWIDCLWWFYQNELPFVLTRSFHRESNYEPSYLKRNIRYVQCVQATLKHPQAAILRSTVDMQTWVDCISKHTIQHLSRIQLSQRFFFVLLLQSELLFNLFCYLLAFFLSFIHFACTVIIVL